ncbi:unnamed protein product, partial [Closterium sp. NIES-53]
MTLGVLSLVTTSSSLAGRIAIFDLDFDAILSAMYALSVSAEGDCYWCVPPNLGIAAAALGASESALPGSARAQALHTFTLDSGASQCFFRDYTTLTPLSVPVPVRLADPSGGPILARSSIVLPCLAVLPCLYHCPPGCDGYYHHSLGSACVNLHVHTDGASPGYTLLWHHRLGHPSLPRLRGMRSRLLVSSLPRSLPPLPPSPAPPCLLCVEGRQSATPHSSSFPPTTAPLQTLHMDVWGPARVSGQGRERYFLLVVDDYTRYTTVIDVLIPWIRTVRLQLYERFGKDLPVLRLHSDKGGEFSSNLLREFCRGEGILQSFTLPDSPQQNGNSERRIGLVMEVARTSMIHAAAPHFLWPFAVRYAANQLNLWPCVSLPETSPTLRWTGEVGDASVFQVWGSRSFVRDTSADKLSARAISCVFHGFVPDVPGWQFYHPTSRRVVPSMDVMFDESVPFYCPPPVDPLPPQGPAPSRVSQVDPLLGIAPVEVAVGLGAAPGAASGGAETGGAGSESAGSGGAELGGEEPKGAEPKGVEPGGAESEGAESGGAEPRGAESGGLVGASPRLSPQQLHEWLVWRARLWSEAPRAGGAGDGGAGGAGVTAGAGGTGGTADAGSGGARTRVEMALEALELEDQEFGALAREVLELQELELLTMELESQPPLQPASSLPVPSYNTELFGGLTQHREPASCFVSPVRTACRAPRLRPPLFPGMHAMALRPSSVPLRVPCLLLLSPLFLRSLTLSPTVSRLLTTVVTDPSFESVAVSAHAAKLLFFAAACRLDYATALAPESTSASPPSVGGECALGRNSLEDRKEDFDCLAAAVPRFASMLLAPEGDPDAPDIPTPRSYAEGITGPYSSQWVKRSAGSPPAFKARYIARGFSQRQAVDYFHTFSPTPKMTTLQHDTLKTTLAALGFTPSTADPSLFLCTDTSLPPFYVLVYVDDLVFATADTEELTLVKSELQRRHTYTDLGELRSYLGLQITRGRARRTITLTQSHMVHQVLQRFSFQFSSPQPTALSTSHLLSAPPLDESVEPSGPYPELVGCLMYLMTCTRPDLAYPLSLLACYVAPGRHRKVHWDAAKRVLRYLCSTSSMGLVLGGRGPGVLTGHADASWVDNSATQRSSQGYTFSLSSSSVSWRSTRSSSVLSSSCEAAALSPPPLLRLPAAVGGGSGGGGCGGDGWCVSLPLLLLSFPLLQLPLGGGCAGVGEPGEWYWGGGCETNQPPLLKWGGWGRR